MARQLANATVVPAQNSQFHNIVAASHSSSIWFDASNFSLISFSAADAAAAATALRSIFICVFHFFTSICFAYAAGYLWWRA